MATASDRDAPSQRRRSESYVIADFVLLGLSLVTGRGARRSSGYARAGLPGRAARSCLPPSGCGRRYVLMTSARMSSWATACIPVVNAVISAGAGTCELVRLRPWCAAPEKGSRQILPESACTCQVRPSTMENGVAVGVVPARSMSAAESRSRYSVRVPSRPPVTASISTSSVFDQCRWGLRRTGGFQNP